MSSANTTIEEPSIKQLVSFGFLAVPLAFVGIPLYLYAPDFYATQQGVSLSALGLVLLLLRVIDAFQDPILGMLSDRYNQHTKAIVIFCALGLGLGFWMLFHPEDGAPLFWLTVSMIIAMSCFSMLTIQMQSLGALWQPTANGTRLVFSWKEALGMIGLLVASILPSLLGVESKPEQAFHQLTLVFVPLLVFGVWLFLIWYSSRSNSHSPPHSTSHSTSHSTPHSHTYSLNPASTFSLTHGLKHLINPAMFSTKDKNFFLVFAISSLASSIPAVLFIFFVRDALALESLTGLFLLIYFLSGALGMPLWHFIAKQIGTIKTWLISMISAILTFGWAWTLGEGQAYEFAIICFLSGLSLGADLALPPSILASHIRTQNKQSHASRYYATMALVSKLALALATGIMLPALGLMDYAPNEANTDHSIDFLVLAYAMIPAIIKCLAAWMLWKKLDEQNITLHTNSTNGTPT